MPCRSRKCGIGWATRVPWRPGIPGWRRPNWWTEGGRGSTPLPGGARLVEPILERAVHRYTFRITDSPLPLRDFVSTIHVRSDGGGCVIEWDATFEASGVAETEASELVADSSSQASTRSSPLIRPIRLLRASSARPRHDEGPWPSPLGHSFRLLTRPGASSAASGLPELTELWATGSGIHPQSPAPADKRLRPPA